MSLEITQYYETEFAKNWEMKLQQKDARLMPTVTTDSFGGKRKSYNQLDVGSMQEVTERKGDTPDGDSTGSKYWIYRRKFEFVRTWDEDDEMQLGSIALPNSDEITSFNAAEARTKDDVIIQALYSSRFIGENGTDIDTFPGTQDIAKDYTVEGVVAADSGLTVEKIIKARQTLDEAEVEDGDRFFITSSQQITDLLNTTKATSSDYVNVKHLHDGKIDMFCGFKFIRSERLPVASAVRACFAYHKSAIKFADAGRNVHMDVLPNRRHAKQLRGVARMGAVRTQNELVVRVYADQDL